MSSDRRDRRIGASAAAAPSVTSPGPAAASTSRAGPSTRTARLSRRAASTCPSSATGSGCRPCRTSGTEEQFVAPPLGGRVRRRRMGLHL